MTEEGREQSPRDSPIGGQAVLEGVMMRGISTWAVAVRKPLPDQVGDDGRLDPTEAARGAIEVVSEPLVSWVRRHRLLRLPSVRGVGAPAEPLKSGRRRSRRRLTHDTSGSETTSIAPRAASVG